jgi:mRNA interferase RelE/StbE
LVKIEWTEPAARDLEKLDRQVARRILKRLTWLSKNFDSVTPEPLTGELRGAFKFRVGDWRVVYTVEGKTIVIQFVGHRREIYKTD